MNTTETLTNGMLCQIPYSAVRAAMDGENYQMSLVGDDARVVQTAVNMGIDSRLQACYLPDRGDEYSRGDRSFVATSDGMRWKQGERVIFSHTLECSVSPESLPVLLRRLYEDLDYTGDDGDDADVGHGLAESILLTLGFDDCGKQVGREALGLE